VQVVALTVNAGSDNVMDVNLTELGPTLRTVVDWRWVAPAATVPKSTESIRIWAGRSWASRWAPVVVVANR